MAVPYARAGNDLCAVRTLLAWLQNTGIHRGPMFCQMRHGDTLTDRRLSNQSVALIIKRRPAAAGVRPEQLSGHSLRVRYATAVAAAGVEERKIANVTATRSSPCCAATSVPATRSTTSAKSSGSTLRRPATTSRPDPSLGSR